MVAGALVIATRRLYLTVIINGNRVRRADCVVVIENVDALLYD